MAELSEMSLKALRIRQLLGRECVRFLRQQEMAGEPKAADAKRYYEAQTREITEEIHKRLRERREAAGKEKPPDQVAQMKVASLGAQAPSAGEGALPEELREELEKRGIFVEKVYTQEVKDG